LFHRDKKFNVWIITSELIDRQRGQVGNREGRSPRASFHWVTDLLSPPISAERSAKERKKREKEREREREEKKKKRRGGFCGLTIDRSFWWWRRLRAIIERLSFADLLSGKKKHESTFLEIRDEDILLPKIYRVYFKDTQ